MRSKASTLFFAVIALFALPMLFPLWSGFLASSTPSALPLGELDVTTVYQADSGQLRMLRVFRLPGAGTDTYQILHNDLQARQQLGAQQNVDVVRRTDDPAPQFKTWSDGRIQLLLGAQSWWRFDPQSGRFEAMNNALIQRFGDQLGTGIAKLAFGTARNPDLLEVTANTGDRYAVYWLTQQIMPLGDQQLQFNQRPFASYTQLQERVDFANFSTDIAKYGRPTTLVRYLQKVRAGEFELLPQLHVHSSTDHNVLTAPKAYQTVSDGYVIAKKSLNEAGMTQVERMADYPVVYRGEVLARNAKRLLVSFEETPTTAAEEVLQLLDADSLQVVWSKPMRAIPQLLQGRLNQAQALPVGFYFTTLGNLPAVVIDNDGQVLNDFRPQER